MNNGHPQTSVLSRDVEVTSVSDVLSIATLGYEKI